MRSNIQDDRLTPTELVENCQSLASLPSIYQELDNAIKSTNVSNFRIAKIINSDPALAAKLLQITNSAQFNFSQKIETISHAVAIVGTAELRDLALATSVISLTKDLPECVIDYQTFWQHSLCCAINCRIVASFRREINLEQHYIAGLLHDIGRLVLMQLLPDKFEMMLQEAKTQKVLLRIIEKKHLGFDHSDVGYELIKHWGLPEYLQIAVGYHHKPGKTKQFQDITTIVHFADLIANKVKAGSSGETLIPQVDKKRFQEMGFSSKMIESVANKMEDQLASALKIFVA